MFGWHKISLKEANHVKKFILDKCDNIEHDTGGHGMLSKFAEGDDFSDHVEKKDHGDVFEVSFAKSWVKTKAKRGRGNKLVVLIELRLTGFQRMITKGSFGHYDAPNSGKQRDYFLTGEIPIEE